MGTRNRCTGRETSVDLRPRQPISNRDQGVAGAAPAASVLRENAAQHGKDRKHEGASHRTQRERASAELKEHHRRRRRGCRLRRPDHERWLTRIHPDLSDRGAGTPPHHRRVARLVGHHRPARGQAHQGVLLGTLLSAQHPVQITIAQGGRHRSDTENAADARLAHHSGKNDNAAPRDEPSDAATRSRRNEMKEASPEGQKRSTSQTWQRPTLPCLKT